MVGIVAVGFQPGEFVPGQPAPPSYPDGLRRRDLDALTEFVAEAVTQQSHVIALYPSWSAEPSLQRLQTVRSALSTTRLTTYGSALPPLAGAVLTSVAGALGGTAPSPGALHAALPLLEAQLLVVAWLGRVTGLRDPAPSLMQHAVSLLPGTAFGVSSWPRPAVRRLTRSDPSVPLPRIRGEVRVAAASRDGDLGWVRDVVVPGLGGPQLTEVEPTALGPRWWGSRRLVEVVAYPTDVEDLRAMVAAERTRPCSWCGSDAAGGLSATACALCHRPLVPIPVPEGVV